MGNELLITLRMKEDGSYVISKVTGDIKHLQSAIDSSAHSSAGFFQANKNTIEQLARSGQAAQQAAAGHLQVAQAAAQSGRGLTQSGKDAVQAGVNYDRLGSSVAMAQAKMLALYAVVRGSYNLFQKGMESIDFYEKAIIRMAASATDAYANLNKGVSEEDLKKYYEGMKAKFGDLVNYAAVASARYFANAREILMVMEFAVSRGHEMSRKGIDQIGMMVDKVKQLVPWIRQEGQALQEINAIWEGRARITDTWARDIIDKMRRVGLVTATEAREATKQFQDILEEWKKGGWESFWEKVLTFYRGAKLATEDIQLTWESTKETIGTTVDMLLRIAGKEIYRDINKYAQEIAQYYLTGADAAKNQAAVAERVKDAWKDTKQFLADAKPIVEGVWSLLKQMDDGRRALPAEIQEAGIVGFFLLGTKGKVAILAILGLLGQVQTSLEGLKAWQEGNLSFWEYMTSGADKLREKLDRLKSTQKQLREEGLDLLEPQQQYPYQYSPWVPLELQSGEWRNEEEDQGSGFWGELTPAGGYGKGRTVFDPRSGMRDLVREHKGSYDEIHRYRQDLDQQYYQGAVEHARGMAQQVGGFYAGMAEAAARYHQEATNLYKQGVKAFAGFTQASEGLLMGFFDIIIWRTGKFTDVMTNFLKRLSNALLESLIVQPLVGLISGGLGSLFGGAANSIFGGGGGFISNLLGLGVGGQADIINEALDAPATGYWPSSSYGGGYGGGFGGGYGGGGAGDGAWLGLLGVGGIGLLAAMMSSNEKGAGGYGGTAESMSVQTMQVAQLVVQGMVSGQSGGAYVSTPALAKEITDAQIKAGSYRFLFAGTGKAQEVESLVATALYVDSARISGLEGLEDILERAGGTWNEQVLQSGNLLEDASQVFFDNVNKGGMSFKESAEEVGRNFRENWQALLPEIIRNLRGPVGGGIGGGILGFLDIFHGGGVIRRAHQGMILGEDERLVIGQVDEGILQAPAMRKLGRRNFEALNHGDFNQVHLGVQAGTPATSESRPEMHVHLHVHALDAESVGAMDWERLVDNRIAPALKKYYSQWIS